MRPYACHAVRVTAAEGCAVRTNLARAQRLVQRVSNLYLALAVAQTEIDLS
jgi:hypothetical protein